MANDRILLEVVVTNKGLKLQQKGIEELTNSTRRAGKASGDLYNTQAKGIIGTANSSKSFSKLAETIGSGGGGLVGAYATLAANAFAVSAAFNALRNGAQVQQIMEGLELQGARTGRSLTLVAQNIERITQGALSGADAMRSAALGTSAGLGAKDLEDLTKVATNASLVLGRSIPDSMDRIIKGVTKLEPELLDELGLMTKLTEASENYARANGKSAASLTNMEKRLAFVEAIKAEGSLKYEGVAEELGTNNLDKLAAAFSNLANSITGAIATSAPLGAVLNLLIESSTALLGALTILGSYVASQYTKSLRASSVEALNASKALDQKAKSLEEYTKKRMGDTKAILDNAKADSAAAAGLNRQQRGKALATQQAALAGDRAAQESWIKSRENSTKRFEREIVKLSSTETDAAKKRIASINQSIQANNLEVQATRAAIEAEKAYASARASTSQNILRTEAARQGSLAQGRASLAMEAAAVGKVGQAYNNVIASTRSYSRSLNLTAEAARNSAASAAANGRSVTFMASAMNLLAPAALRGRVAIHALTLSIKTLGIAFATALPWIGMLMFAFSLAQTAYESFFKTNETKAKEKALEDLGTVLESLTKSTEEFKKVQDSTNLTIGSKSLKALTIQTNAMVELTDAYLKFSEAYGTVSKVQEEGISGGPGVFRGEEFTKRVSAQIQGLLSVTPVGQAVAATLYLAPSIDQNLLKKELGLATDTAAKAAKSMVNIGDMVTDFFGGDGLYDEEVQLVKTIDTIATFDKALAESIDTSKGFEQTQKNTESALRKAQPVWEAARLAVQNFAEAIKTAETAQADFMRSIVPTTKFDNVVGAFTGLNKSLLELQKTLGEGRFDDSQFSELLTNLGPSVVRTLDVSDQLNLDAVKTQFSEIGELQRSLKDLQEDGLGTSQESLNIESKIASLKERIKVALKNSEPSILRATQEYRKQLVDSQVMAITMQGTLALAQANLSVIQRRGVVLAEDASKQMKAENAIIGLQQKQLQAEKTFLDIDIAKQQNKLKEIDSNLKLLKITQELESTERQRVLTMQIMANKMVAIAARASGDEKSANIFEGRNVTLEAARNDIKSTYLRLLAEQKDLQEDIRRSLAGSEALQGQITALGMQAFSAAEMQAAQSRRQLEIDSQRKSILRDITRMNSSINGANKEIFNSLSLGTNEIAVQNFLLTERAEQNRAALKLEFDQKNQALEIEKKLAKAQGLEKRVEFYQDEQNLLDAQFRTSIALANVEELKEKVQLAAVKTIQEKLELERESLNIQQKAADSIKELASANLEAFNLTLELDSKRAGVTDNESIQRIKGIKAAENAFKLSEAEYGLKVSLIKLEFALLEAQRIQLIDSLAQRKKVLEDEKSRLNNSIANESTPGNIIVNAKKELTATDENIGILSKAIDDLSGANFKEAMENALKAAGILKENAKLNFDLAKEQGPRVQGGFLSSAANMGAAVQAGTDAGISTTSIGTDVFKVHFETMRQSLEELGPEGSVVSALSESAMSMSNSFVDAFNVIGDKSSTTTEKVSAGLQALSSIISGVASILAASSNARIANIDREIAAEQKRDGKSAQSLAAIEAMEKKKDSIARKQFNTNKKLMMANAVVSTAAGIANALGSGLPPPANIILAGLIGAMGAAQLAIISGTQYESTSASRSTSLPSTLSIGRRGDTVDLARGPSANAGGEAGFLRGSQGTGSNANNFRTIGSAYGGELMRGFGNRGFVVGEKGPEVITPETPINVTPANDVMPSQPLNATFNIQALDASGVEELLVGQKGNIIKMLRDAANASGQGFMEDVNVNVYTRPQVNKL